MKRSQLKNIINKSKEISNNKLEIVGESSFDLFKKSLPIEIDDNYRLEAAWKAYGKPKNYQEALWLGLIQPIDENNVKLPSIGYDEESDTYEYLNSGKENETIAKDIRVWDNDVIPFVKELKQGGFIRTFNEEKNCWTYKKGKEVKKEESQNIPRKMELSEIKDKVSFMGYLHTNGFDVNKYDYDAIWDNEEARNEFILKLLDIDLGLLKFKNGGQMTTIPSGSLHARKNDMELAVEGKVTPKGIPVVSENEGEIIQHAEIERNEIIFNKEFTDFIEENYKKFSDDETTNAEKDELAIKVGKKLVKEILENTDDKTGLIEEVDSRQNL